MDLATTSLEQLEESSSMGNDNETLPLEKMFDCLLQDIFSQRTARLSDDVDSRVSRALRASSRL